MPPQEITVRKILRQGLLADLFTRSLYAASPYRGCGHGCLYCDGRAEKYYVAGDFVQDIQARVNAAPLLAAELDRIRERGPEGRRCLLALGSGVSDIYQPLEARLQLTRQCAEVLAERTFPVLLITKSALALRDLDLWRRVAAGPGCILLMSVATVDEEVRRRFEPGASSIAARLETLRAFRGAGCATGVLAMPVLPGISDGEVAVEQLFEQVAATGVEFIMPGGLTLRPGRQKSLYLDEISRLDPELSARSTRIYAEERASGSPCFPFRREQEQRLARIRRRHGVPFLLPHRVLAPRLPDYESLYLLFSDMQELYAERGVPIAALQRGARRYAAWLKERRTTFRRRRSLPDDWIGAELRSLLATGEFETLLDNPKLAAFAREVLEGRCELDYVTLARHGQRAP